MGAYTEAGRRHWRTNIERIFSLFPVLAERSNQFAGTLSGGEQQMLAIGVGLRRHQSYSCWTNHRWGWRQRWRISFSSD